MTAGKTAHSWREVRYLGGLISHPNWVRFPGAATMGMIGFDSCRVVCTHAGDGAILIVPKLNGKTKSDRVEEGAAIIAMAFRVAEAA